MADVNMALSSGPFWPSSLWVAIPQGPDGHRKIANATRFDLPTACWTFTPEKRSQQPALGQPPFSSCCHWRLEHWHFSLGKDVFNVSTWCTDMLMRIKGILIPHKHQLTLHKLRHQRTAKKKSATTLVKSIASCSVMPGFPQKRLSNDAP